MAAVMTASAYFERQAQIFLAAAATARTSHDARAYREMARHYGAQHHQGEAASQEA